MKPLRSASTSLSPHLRTIGSLFSGIGGLEKGLEDAGCGSTVFQVEIDPFCQQVLARHWPLVERHTDVRTVGRAELSRVDLLCGGFPCTDVSLAGKRAGLKGERSGLWTEYVRIIDALSPKAVVIENVLGLRSSGLSQVLADLADRGFDAEWACLSAAALGAPHLRRRIFIVATHPNRIAVRDEPGWLARAFRQAASEHRFDPSVGVAPDTDSLGRLEQARRVAHERGWSRHCGWELDRPARVDDVLPGVLDGGVISSTRPKNIEARRKALGNAVVVACAKVVGQALIGAVTTA